MEPRHQAYARQMGNETPDDKAMIVSLAKDAAGAVAAAGVGVAAAAATNPPNNAIVLGVLIASFFPPLLAGLTERAVRRLKNRSDRFFTTLVGTWAADEEITHEEVAARLETAKESDDASEAAWRATRSLLEAVNDDVAIPLGVLTAEYMKSGHKPDAFFRATVRVLQELTKQEVLELSQLLDLVESSTARDEVRVSAHDQRQRDRGPWEPVPWFFRLYRDNEPGTPDREVVETTFEVVDGDRLIWLLQTSGFGRDSSPGTFGGQPAAIELKRPAVMRLAKLLRLAR